MLMGKAGSREICTFSEMDIHEIAEYLKNAGLEVLYTGHCTGRTGYLMLKKELGDRIKALTTGIKIEF